MKYALKSVPGLADVGVSHGDGDGPRTPAPDSGSIMDACPVDQHEQVKPGFTNYQPQPKYSWAFSKIEVKGKKDNKSKNFNFKEN